MGQVSGKEAKVSFDSGNVASLGGWDLNIATDMHDTTSLSTGTLQWRSNITGLSGWTGTVDGGFDGASTGQDNLRGKALAGTTATITLYIDKTGGGKFSGGCVITSMSHTANLDSLGEVSYGLTGNGALTFTTTT